MAKYIIDIDNDDYLVSLHGVGSCSFKKVTDLKPYTEPDEDEIRQKEGEYGEKAWQLFRNICELNGTECIEAFDTISCRTVLEEMTYSEAKAKYDEWAKEKSRIRVGDEVEYPPNKEKGIVIKCHVPDVYAEVDKYAVFTGTSVEYLLREWLTKTGRVFPEVAELLKKMGKLDD